MRYINNNSTRLVTVFLVLFAMSTTSFGQKLAKGGAAPSVIASSVQGIFFEGPGEAGNPDCSDLNGRHANGSGDIRFSHIITDNELKLDFGTPSGSFPYTTGNGRLVIGP